MLTESPHLLLPMTSDRRASRALSLGVVGLLHVLLFWGLLHTLDSRHAAAGPAPQPLFVQVVSPPSPPATPDVPLPAPTHSAPPALAPLVPPPLFVTDAVAPETALPVQTARPAADPPAAIAPPSSASAPPAPVPAERQIAITQVEYLTPPTLLYPLASRRLREQGEAQVRVRVDEQGRPDRVLLVRSTGSERLDEVALATVRATRFKPYTENGTARPFWVLMPLIFELDN